MEYKGFDPKYDDTKKANEIIFGKAKILPDGSKHRKAELILEPENEYLSKKFSGEPTNPLKFNKKDDLILYSTKGGQQKIHCWLVESTDVKKLTALHISRRTNKGLYGSQEILLLPEAVFALKEFLNKIIITDTSSTLKFVIGLNSTPSSKGSNNIISETDFIEIIKNNVDKTDAFYKLLYNKKIELAIEHLKKIIEGNYKNEIDIQKLLKENLWMFGNEFSQIIEDNKINSENILDIIPQNIENYIDIIEVKLPKEKLFHFDQSHNNYYCSSKLTKAIAQTQNYIFELEKASVNNEYTNIKNCKIVRPRGIVLFGSEKILDDKENKYLRVLNASFHNLQIITYQQLLQKAENTYKTIGI